MLPQQHAFILFKPVLVAVAKKTLSLKISATSASLISSGKVKEDPKKVNMEDGTSLADSFMSDLDL